MNSATIADTITRRDFMRAASVLGAATLAGRLAPGALAAAGAPGEEACEQG